MIKSSKAPKILFIKGVFKRDCISDDIFEQKILENSDITQQVSNPIGTVDNNGDMQYGIDSNFIKYDKLPNIFESIETWPKKTNLLCWNCTLPFNSVPVFIPKVLEPLSIRNRANMNMSDFQNLSISVKGVFCGFGCCVDFVNNTNYSSVYKTETINKIKLLHKIFYGRNMKDVSYYPHPSLMSMYGGNMTVEDYKVEKDKHTL
jgi:hypothetical protein